MAEFQAGYRPRNGPPDSSFAYHNVVEVAGTAIATILLTILMTSFAPFISGTAEFLDRPAGPNAINQFGFSTLGALSVAGMLMFAKPGRIGSLFDPAWLIIFALLAWSAFQADQTNDALRAIMFNMVIVVTCIGVLAIPASALSFRQASSAAVMLVLLLSYFGVIFMPSIATHVSGSLEPQHIGLWRGVFTHKNVAGPVMAIFLFFGIYFMRSGQRWTGIAIIVLSTIFVIQTGSKTTNGLVPIAIAAVISGRIFGSRILPLVLLLWLFIFASAMTVGTAIHPPLYELIAPYLEDPSFTGRDTLWAFGIEKIMEQPWTGYGFDNFWGQRTVKDLLVPFDADWDYRGSVNGHNNFIDLILFMGIPAACIVIWILCVRPLWHYLRCRPTAENRRFADLCLMILAFVLLNSLLESSWFRRADPTWILTIIAILGLRHASRIKL